MTHHRTLLEDLPRNRRRWLVTGAAGFIGSHLVEALLKHGQAVIGLDNFATGHRSNLEEALATVGGHPEFTLIEGDIRDAGACREACTGADLVLHQAALGSVPRSLEDPQRTHAANVDGFLNVIVAARDAGVRRFVYASSSSVYGDHPALPKVEHAIGAPLSPYALTKLVDEQYAAVFSRCYGLQTVGLRYFNVFGQRQDPEGPYAAVIPRWVNAMLSGEPVHVNGDGESSRDFCCVTNVVQANLLSALADLPDAASEVFNVAAGERTTLNQLFAALAEAIAPMIAPRPIAPPVFRDFRPGDVRHSLADIGHAARTIGYAPTHGFGEGLAEALDWYARKSRACA